MTYSVYATTTKKMVEKLDEVAKEFERIHKHSEDLKKFEGHVFYLVDPSEWKLKDPPFISIPCHWDYDHMMQTQEDIKVAVRTVLNQTPKTEVSY